MSLFKNSQRALVIVGLVGLAAAASTTQASAFGGFGGGGHGGGFGGGFGGGHGGGFGGGGFGGGHGGGFGGGGFGGGRGGFGNGGRFSGIGFGGGGRHPMGHRPGGNMRPGGFVGNDTGRNRPGRPGKVECFRAPCNVGGHPNRPHWPHWPNMNWPVRHPHGDCGWSRSCGPRPVSCRYNSWSSFCRPHWQPPVIQVRYPMPPVYAPPAYGSGPSYAAVAPSYSPAPAYSAPAAAPAPAYAPPAPACVKDPTISLVFQPTVTAADITTFLKSFNVTMENGPNNDGVYRIRVNAVPQEQLSQLIEAMRAQTNVVSQVGA